MKVRVVNKSLLSKMPKNSEFTNSKIFKIMTIIIILIDM